MVPKMFGTRVKVAPFPICIGSCPIKLKNVYMRIRTAEKRRQTHKICAFLQIQLCLIPTNLIGKAVINPALFTVGMEAAACGFSLILGNRLLK